MKLSDIVGSRGPVAFRLAAAIIAGLATSITAMATGRSHYAPAVGWITTSVVYLLWTWAVIWRMDSAATREHALLHERDGTRRLSHIIVVVASLVSLAGVGYLFYATSGDKPDAAAGMVGVLSVVASWLTIHTVYTLRYARLYYNAPDPQHPGMDFDGITPSYADFAYVAFTVGMCYSTPEGLSNRKLRATVLRQSFLSYLFGTIIIATTLNLVSGLTG